MNKPADIFFFCVYAAGVCISVFMLVWPLSRANPGAASWMRRAWQTAAIVALIWSILGFAHLWSPSSEPDTPRARLWARYRSLLGGIDIGIFYALYMSGAFAKKSDKPQRDAKDDSNPG